MALSSWLRLCFILTFAGEFNTYVLFAANVDDFRNIARKIVPEALADKLARLASVPAKQKSRVDITDSDEYESETDDFENEGDAESEANLKKVNSMYVRDWNTRVNFEELVERVKDRLAKEMKEEIQKRLIQKGENANPYSQPLPKIANIDTANKETFGYNIDRIKSENVNYNSYNKYNTHERFSKVTRNYEPITNYYDDKEYEVAEKIYPNKNIKPEYFDYQEGTKQSYNDRDYDKYKSATQKDIYNTNVKINDNIKDEEYVEKYVYENYDDNLQKNQHYGIENGPKETKNTYPNEKYYVKDNERFVDKEYGDLKEPKKEIKIHHHLKQTTPDVVKFDNYREPLFKEFDLISTTKNDSYEDYAVPNKEENIFESEETNTKELKTESSNINYNTNKNSRFKIKNNANLEKVRPFKSEWKVDRYNGKADDTKESEEIKAKTESLWFDDRFKDTEIVSETSKGKGTMIPTRETYKMSSPNYYISLPTVAERYDSDEPLPEKDRERQIIKHFVNPPASINKKVRLLK